MILPLLVPKPQQPKTRGQLNTHNMKCQTVWSLFWDYLAESILNILNHLGKGKQMLWLAAFVRGRWISHHHTSAKELLNKAITRNTPDTGSNLWPKYDEARPAFNITAGENHHFDEDTWPPRVTRIWSHGHESHVQFLGTRSSRLSIGFFFILAIPFSICQNIAYSVWM